MGFREQADEVQDGSWPATTPARRPRCRSTSSTAPACSATSDRIAERLDRLAAAGVTSVAVSCFDRDLDGKIATLTTVMPPPPSGPG